MYNPYGEDLAPPPQLADLSQVNGPQFGPHDGDPRGMFGIHGVARNILGLLGDAFLTQSGNKEIYSPQRADEADSGALQGFVDNPMAAIQRLTQTNPHEALGAYFKANDDTRLKRQADETYNGTVLDRALRMLGAANKDNYPAVRAQVEAYAKTRGVPLPFELPADYSEDGVRGAMMNAVPVDKQADDSRLLAALQLRRELGLDRNDQGWARIGETGRHNEVIEGQGADRIGETGRHNQATEGNTRRGQDITHGDRVEGHKVTVRGQDIRDARAERTTGKTVSSRVRNDKGEVVVGYKDGTTQTFRNSHPLTGKSGGRQPVRREAPQGIPTVNSRAEAYKLPANIPYFKTPDGQTLHNPNYKG